VNEISFGNFCKLAKSRGHTVESLADRFRGKIENPSEFFERVMSCRYHGEDRSWVVIPYRSVIEFYSKELHYFQDSNQKHRQCACGCGQPVFDRKKWASSGCRQKIARQKVTDTQGGVRQAVDFIDARV
jgi:hypothetical protein